VIQTYNIKNGPLYVNVGLGKGKVIPVHAMKAYRGSRRITPLILHLGTKRM
jgi:hypothetical protein